GFMLELVWPVLRLFAQYDLPLPLLTSPFTLAGMKYLLVVALSLLLACPVLAAAGPATKPTTMPTTRPAPPLPFFFIGVWMQPNKDLKKWKDRGVNVAVTDKPKPDKSTREAYFAAAAAAGMKVVIYPDPVFPANDLKQS